MEYVSGGSLHDRIHDMTRPALTYMETLLIARDIAEALAYLHPGIVHRDLKPHNVLLDSAGRAKLIDFGLSRDKDIMRSCLMTTEVGGTPLYMAPELFDGGAQITEKVDVYSLAMILHECLTGQVPWADCTMTVQVVFAVRVNQERPVIPDACPTSLSRLLIKCWAPDPVKRPSCAEVVKLLDHMIRDSEEGRPLFEPIVRSSLLADGTPQVEAKLERKASSTGTNAMTRQL